MASRDNVLRELSGADFYAHGTVAKVSTTRNGTSYARAVVNTDDKPVDYDGEMKVTFTQAMVAPSDVLLAEFLVDTRVRLLLVSVVDAEGVAKMRCQQVCLDRSPKPPTIAPTPHSQIARRPDVSLAERTTSPPTLDELVRLGDQLHGRSTTTNLIDVTHNVLDLTAMEGVTLGEVIDGREVHRHDVIVRMPANKVVDDSSLGQLSRVSAKLAAVASGV